MILIKEYYNFVLLGSFVHSFEFRADLIIINNENFDKRKIAIFTQLS